MTDEASRKRLGRAKARLDATVAWAGERMPWGELVVQALERERLSAAGLLAGGLAYRLFFWLVPLGLLFAAVLSFWIESDRPSLESAAQDFGIGAAAVRGAGDAVEQGAHSRWYFLSAGGVLVVWFGAGVVRAMSVAHAVAWRLRPERLRSPFAAGAVFTVVTSALVVVTGASAWAREQTAGPGLALTLGLSLLYVAVFTWASTKLPSRASSWRAFVPGAVLVTLGTQVVHLLVVLYLAPKLGRSSELYGTLGAATVVLLWLYLEARLVVAAAFLNAALWDRAQSG